MDRSAQSLSLQRAERVLFVAALCGVVVAYFLPALTNVGDDPLPGYDAAVYAAGSLMDAVEDVAQGNLSCVSNGHMTGFCNNLMTGVGTFSNLAFLIAPFLYFGRRHWIRQLLVWVCAPSILFQWSYLAHLPVDGLGLGYFVWCASGTLVIGVLLWRYRRFVGVSGGDDRRPRSFH